MGGGGVNLSPQAELEYVHTHIYMRYTPLVHVDPTQRGSSIVNAYSNALVVIRL